MALQEQFPNVRWIWLGGSSFVYEVHPLIVVKVPRANEEAREYFQKELKIYEILSRYPPCPYIVQCFLYTENGIFMEYMHDVTLYYRISRNCERDLETRMVTKVKKLEPLNLRAQWMHDLTQAVAFLESLGLAHGDLRPENAFFDGDRLKLSDFDCTAEIGSHYEACIGPWGRLLGPDADDPQDQGTGGSLGPRTEQFALGSLYYFINYGFEVYEDQILTEDPKEHGPKTVDLLQEMTFPKLNGDPVIDDIIDKCWHNKFATIAELAARMEELLLSVNSQSDTEPKFSSPPCTVEATLSAGGNATVLGAVELNGCTESHLSITKEQIDVGVTSVPEPRALEAVETGGVNAEKVNDGTNQLVDCNSVEDTESKKLFCQNLVDRGLLHKLCSREPKELGFQHVFYRYSRWA